MKDRSYRSRAWRIWPILALVIALLFIVWDMVLVSGTLQVQQKISDQLNTLDQLEQINGSISRLEMAHQVEMNTGNSHWNSEVELIQRRIADLQTKITDDRELQHTIPALDDLIEQADSLHRLGAEQAIDPEAQARTKGVLSIVLRRSNKLIDDASRHIRADGLDEGISNLNNRWDRAQEMLLVACLLAIFFAFMLGMHRKLLDRTRHQSAQLMRSKEELERTNIELRETMLSKEEKEVMIKEIHHRVKNNLQIVKSLIRFQLDQVDDPLMQERFHECVNRVAAMALVHEQTYLSNDLANINVSSYLDQLVHDLVHAYNISTPLEMDVDIHIPTLTVDTLIPLGLLINEVISNSLKYAFPEKDKGKISVHLQGSEKSLHLRIGDNGIGLPDKSKWQRPQSLGMELIYTLAEQLDAEIMLLNGEGTVYELRSGAALNEQKRA